MPRPKTLVDAQLKHMAEASLATIKDSDLSIRLMAIIAACNRPADDVAEVLHVARRSIFRWINRYRDGGLDALKDRPKGHRISKLNDAQKEDLKRWIGNGVTPQGEPVLWTVRKLQSAISNEFSISLSKTPLLRLMKQMDLVLRRPRPKHAKSDAQAQEAFKKNSRKS